jgi:hypothetical protein
VKKLIALFVSAGLVLALVLSGCAAPEPEVVEKTVKETVTETVEVEKTYQCLNPKGEFIPVELYPIAPRLDTLDGKTILYYQSEANPVIMPVLIEWLKRDYPTTTFDIIYTEAWGEATPTEEQIAKYEAVIRGISW